MNYIDLILIVIIAFSIWIGWEKGLISACLDLCVWAGSLAAGFAFYAPVASILVKITQPFAWLLPVSFILVVLIAGILMSILCRTVARHVDAAFLTSRINHILGILPGFVNGCISAVVVTLIFLSVPLGDNVFMAAKASPLAARFSPAGEWMQEHISPVFYEVGKQNMARLAVETGTEKTMRLPFTKENTTVRADLEIKMLQMVNEERKSKGLAPLVNDTALQKLARTYSKDMFARGYFSHYTPEKENPFDRMRKANIRFLTAGENLALAHTLAIAHKGLMNSPGHRANILNPAFGRLGIGIVDGGIYGIMVSQEFRD